MCYCTISPANLIGFIKQMMRSRHSQPYKKNRCSVKLQDGVPDPNARKISVEGFSFNKLKKFIFFNKVF